MRRSDGWYLLPCFWKEKEILERKGDKRELASKNKRRRRAKVLKLLVASSPFVNKIKLKGVTKKEFLIG